MRTGRQGGVLAAAVTVDVTWNPKLGGCGRSILVYFFFFLTPDYIEFICGGVAGETAWFFLNACSQAAST